MILIDNKREALSTENNQPKSKRRRTMSQQQAIATTGPHANDVLCGRGGLVNKYTGNVAFRRVVEINKNIYHSCPKEHKFLLAQSIVEAIMKQNPPGRFLSQEKGTGKWFNIGKAKAIQKTSQALRENAEQIRKKLDAKLSNTQSNTQSNTLSNTPSDLTLSSKDTSLIISSSNIPNLVYEYNKYDKCNSGEDKDSDVTSSVGSLGESDIESLTSSVECLAPTDMDKLDLFSDDSIFDDNIDESLDTFLREARVDTIPSSPTTFDAYSGVPISKIENSKFSEVSFEPLDKDDPICNSTELLSTLDLCKGIWEL